MEDRVCLHSGVRRQIPDVVVQRLPLYARALALLAQEGVRATNSFQLGKVLGTTPAQIRKDLSYFGRFGKQGMGYDVGYLLARLRRILGLDQEWPMALVGVGRLGQAVARYPGFSAQGFKIVALFDSDPQKVGKVVEGLVIHPLTEMTREIPAKGIKIGILAVPAARAQEVAGVLLKSGVKAILNYAPLSLQVPSGIIVRSLDPALVLQSMTFYLNLNA
jgi:redox-sensing transcriptional repressor